jgi:hypothetical protein
MSERVFYQGGGFCVSGRLLRTPRKTYRLDQVEFVSVQRPLLWFLGLPAVGLIGFTVAFWRYLLPGEAALLIGLSLGALVFAPLFGVLRVHSLALRDDDVAGCFGLAVHLKHVRRAVEQAMAHGDDRGAVL